MPPPPALVTLLLLRSKPAFPASPSLLCCKQAVLKPSRIRSSTQAHGKQKARNFARWCAHAAHAMMKCRSKHESERKIEKLFWRAHIKPLNRLWRWALQTLSVSEASQPFSYLLLMSSKIIIKICQNYEWGCLEWRALAINNRKLRRRKNFRFMTLFWIHKRNFLIVNKNFVARVPWNLKKISENKLSRLSIWEFLFKHKKSLIFKQINVTVMKLK